ncbi:MAG: hypothetical protein H6660_15480 [Ardenticatenaceae bacterium]|nr:hypothetical protein [Ardenticatenaceae bacterium]
MAQAPGAYRDDGTTSLFSSQHGPGRWQFLWHKRGKRPLTLAKRTTSV